jgi:membrane protease YdiL (CAAX protease family)
VINQLVERFGRTGFAAISSLIWALPMAAWAGTSDLSPVDRTATPWIALGIGLVMLVVWIVLLSRLGRVPVSPRQRRFDLAQMSTSEKTWMLVLLLFFAGLVAWLNGAATVDWSPLGSAIGSGKPGPLLFAAGLGIFLIAMVAGILITWHKASTAYRRRLAGAGANLS